MSYSVYALKRVYNYNFDKKSGRPHLLYMYRYSGTPTWSFIQELSNTQCTCKCKCTCIMYIRRLTVVQSESRGFCRNRSASQQTQSLLGMPTLLASGTLIQRVDMRFCCCKRERFLHWFIIHVVQSFNTSWSQSCDRGGHYVTSSDSFIVNLTMLSPTKKGVGPGDECKCTCTCVKKC